MKRNLSGKENGITLIALVITLIVLLILASVAIAMLTGENGILTKAETASTKTTEESALEKVKLAVSGSLGTDGKINLQEVADNLNKTEGMTQIDTNTFPITTTVDGYEFEILESGTVVKVLQESKITNMFDETGLIEGKIHIGDYISYTPDDAEEYNIPTNIIVGSGSQSINQDKSLGWRVLDIKDGNVRLISSKVANTKIVIGSYYCYENTVFVLNDLCKALYSNSKYGEAKSTSIDDIQDKLDLGVWDYKTYTNGVNLQYGSTKAFTGNNAQYPSIFLKEKGQVVDGIEGAEYGISEQKDIITKCAVKDPKESIEVKQTFWTKSLERTNFINPKYYDIFIGGNYWLASRYTNLKDSCAEFGIQRMNSSTVNPYMGFSSDGMGGFSNYEYLKPIVTLKSNVQIDKENSGDGSTAENSWKLK